MGPVCGKAARNALPQPYEGDLLGYDVDHACRVATEVVDAHINAAATAARHAIRHAAREMRAMFHVEHT
jgi:hypothetical protein